MDFSSQILKWYENNRRDLPWRHTNDPYKIWLSEVILQQTRVEQGTSYYLKFIDEYPHIRDLAEAPEQEVLKLWQGLGYYSRARNLLFAAKQVMTEYNGIFPKTHKNIIKLKGVGDYTASAIASIAFGETEAVVDGNVKRVISRVFGYESSGLALHQKMKEVMTNLMDHGRPGDFNQAVMEFGALHCTPKSPACSTCIFKNDCKALKMGMVEKLPVMEKKKKPTRRYFSYFFIQVPGEKGAVIMNKRIEQDIWKNLYEFPLIETENEISADKLQQNSLFRSWFGNGASILETSEVYKHQLSHQSIYARYFTVDNIDFNAFPEGWKVISMDDIEDYPVSRLIEKFLEERNQ